MRPSDILRPRNRGLLLDLVVFILNLALMGILTRVSINFVQQAETDRTAEFAIGLYFAVLFLLQPVGPVLRRWSAHREKGAFDVGSAEAIGCLLIWFMFFYLIMMILVAGTATILMSEAVFNKGPAAETAGTLSFLAGVVISVFSVVCVYRYFLPPKKAPAFAFLASPAAATVGEISMILNVILLQLLWNCITVSQGFWGVLISTPLGKSGSITDIAGRFIVIGVLALLVYLPPRIFFLVNDRNRKLAWLTMFLANLPLIVRAVFATRSSG